MPEPLVSASVEFALERSAEAHKIILLDNGSAPEIEATLAGFAAETENCTVIRNDNDEGFAFGANQIFAANQSPFLALLSADTLVSDNWLTRSLSLLEVDEDIAAVGPLTNYGPDGFQKTDVTYTTLAEFDTFAQRWHQEHVGETWNSPQLSHGCMVMRKVLVDRIGGFDTSLGHREMERDFALRSIRAGGQLVVACDVMVHTDTALAAHRRDLHQVSIGHESWEAFCRKWNHPPEQAGTADIQQLNIAEAFNAGNDHIPVQNDLVFYPDAPPLELESQKQHRFLAIPDWRTPAWASVIETFLTTFSSEDPVALVVRLEPPSEGVLRQGWDAITGILQKHDMDPKDAADILFEASSIPPRSRGSLYTSAQHLLMCPGRRAPTYAREARFCGLNILEDITPDSLRSTLENRKPAAVSRTPSVSTENMPADVVMEPQSAVG